MIVHSGPPIDLLTILAHLLDPSQLDRATSLAMERGEPLDVVCTRLGLCSEDDLANAFARSLGLERCGNGEFPAIALLDDVCSRPFLRASRVLLVRVSTNEATLAMVDPTDADAIRGVEFAAERRVIPVVCTATDFEQAWARLYSEVAPAANGSGARADPQDEGLSAPWASLLDRPHGILLVTGPTGSGKSTTLYASLSLLNQPGRKLRTIEDPVEQQIEGVNQVHAQRGIGFGFGAALRAFLRHDPDIIMVGEIRDQETARTAVQAALTGHLILSKLHTNDAVSGVIRLLDMGIDSYLIAATLHGVLAQRLVRKLCTSCGGLPPAQADCAACAGAGYKGRLAIGELLVVTPAFRSLIEHKASHDELMTHALADGSVPMAVDGAAHVEAGRTTAAEIGRTTLDQSAG